MASHIKHSQELAPDPQVTEAFTLRGQHSKVQAAVLSACFILVISASGSRLCAHGTLQGHARLDWLGHTHSLDCLPQACCPTDTMSLIQADQLQGSSIPLDIKERYHLVAQKPWAKFPRILTQLPRF